MDLSKLEVWELEQLKGEVEREILSRWDAFDADDDFKQMLSRAPVNWVHHTYVALCNTRRFDEKWGEGIDELTDDQIAIIEAELAKRSVPFQKQTRPERETIPLDAPF